MVSDPRLYEIGAELEALVAELIEAEGELTPDLEARLDAVEAQFATKAEKVICAIRNAEARAAGIRFEIAELTRRLEALALPHEQTAKSLRLYLEVQMRRGGKKRVDMPMGKAWLQANARPKIDYVGKDPDRFSDLPEHLVRVTYTIDGAAAWETWRNSVLPDELHAEVGEHLRIK